jgi:hypothetical protein
MHNEPKVFVLVIKEWHVHRPGELVVNVGMDSKGVPVPLPPPLVRLAPPAPIFLPVIPLPLLGRVPPCQLALRPALKLYPKGAESLLARDNRLLLPPLPPPAPALGTEVSSTAVIPPARFSFDVRCRFTLTRSSHESVSKRFIDVAGPGLGGSGVDVAGSALELG